MNEEKKEFFTIVQASRLSGLFSQTVRKMADSSQINSYKTPSGQRRINKESLQTFCNIDLSSKSLKKSQRQNFLYVRVSTKKQMDDLSRQIKYIQRPKYVDYILISNIGSGINFKRKGLQTILDHCIQRTIR